MDEKSIDDLIAEAERELKEAEERARASEPDTKVKRLAEIEKGKRDAREQEAANRRTERSIKIAAREAAIRKTLTDGTIVKGVDLYDLFPLGSEPANMPACGFVVLRNPEPSASAKKDASVQSGDRSAHEIGVEYVAASTMYPTAGDDAVKFRMFLETHAEATGQLVTEVRDLGGAKSKNRPLGRG